MKALAALLIAAALTSPLNAQDSTLASPHPYRSPRRALILGSIIPGAGHIYAGEYWHGIRNYEATVMTIGLGTMTFIVDRCTFSFLSTTTCDPGPQWPHRAAGVALVGLGFWQWISSARDAPRAAERANEKHRRKNAKAKPIFEAPAGSGGSWRAGLAIPL